MELYLNHEQETQLARIALRDGKSGVAELLREVALRILAEEARFEASVLEGKAQADRGEFMEEDEMDARFEQMLRS